MHILPYGEHAILVEMETLAEVHALREAVVEAGLGVDVVPAWRSLLISADGDMSALANEVRGLRIRPPGEFRGRRHKLPITYDGPDPAEVAQMTGLSVRQVCELHAGNEYVVAFLGFSRGFPHLAGLDPALNVPRLSTPRVRVPPGSVAITGEQCGIYPMSAPGGWRLLGRTHTDLFDPLLNPPSRLLPGDRVRFVPAT